MVYRTCNFLENVTISCEWIHALTTNLGCWGYLLAINLQIYHETLSLQQADNIPKLLCVLRLMLQKTGRRP